MKEKFNPRERLLEQLQMVFPDKPYTPMVKYVQPYKDTTSKAKTAFMDLETVHPDKLKFWSDTHFGHANIIKYCNRPFADTKKMDARMIQNYFDHVQDDDVVIWVGDVAFTDHEHINGIIKTLPGYKILVVGNHDFHHRHKFPIQYDFDETHLVLTVGDFVISHHPWWNVPGGWYNIHGHLHDRKTDNPKHFNVGVELLDYKPISLTEIIKALGI